MSEDLVRGVCNYVVRVADLLEWYFATPPNYDNEAKQRKALRLFQQQREWNEFHEEAVRWGEKISSQLTAGGFDPAPIPRVTRMVEACDMEALANGWEEFREKIEAKVLLLPQHQGMRQSPPCLRMDGHDSRVVAAETPKTPDVPKEYLLNWRAILDALGLKSHQQRKLSQLNQRFSGPIPKAVKGGQPKVAKAKLVEWWNGLETSFSDLQERRESRRASVTEEYPFGRDGIVKPGIVGAVKRRRNIASPKMTQHRKR